MEKEIASLLIELFENTTLKDNQIDFQSLQANFHLYNEQQIEELNFVKLPNMYPVSPFTHQIAFQLSQLFTNGTCCLPSSSLYLLDEKDYEQERHAKFKEAGNIASEAAGIWNTLDKNDRLWKINKILQVIGFRGILDMLGVRKTTGSKDSLPIPRERLLEEFRRPYEKSKELSVGAKALAKHCHRDKTVNWWGTCNGSESEKSRKSLAKVTELIDEAAWINIHQLPHQIAILEVRNAMGYGARWALDDAHFIGFVEPQKEDGWKDKYQH